MTPPTGAAPTAPSDAPQAYVDQSSAYPNSGTAPEGTDATGTRTSDGSQNPSQSVIEKDVGTILAGLNQEQLESIVAAARATDGGDQHGYGSNQYDSANALAHLPPGLGQAASTLTSFASSFKRTNAGGMASEDDMTSGAGGLSEASSHLGDAPPPPGMEHDMQHQRHVHGQAHKGGPSAAHDPAATAAALAAMGTLAGRQLPPHSQAHALGERDATLGADAGMDAKFVSDHALGNARYKRKGPELDRQRKDNHKEVERRRRSAINDGIVQLSQIVPGCDVKNTNKGSIIIAAVRYIQDLKNNEASNIEKWTLEKLLMDQAMNDLSMSLDESRREVERLRAQLGMAEANSASNGADKAGTQDNAGAHAYQDQRFATQQTYQGGAADGTHAEQDLGVSLEHAHSGNAGLEHATNMLGSHGLDAEANKRARLV
ncbi:basic helix-loop-helix protein [Malassezia pachydermatis]|uniref:Centromere binding factor 1 n=1 Tax=Malassezia pachydermatis TaxID=77020 RepID=A0A0M8MQ80_9BASI|nr:centromere binding factor 1 [Malassezia pachydermatis]KOS16148.1 centromere binding factor 1 [Malassezia pachydermatis]